MINGGQLNTLADKKLVPNVFSTSKLGKGVKTTLLDERVSKAKALSSEIWTITPELARHIIENYNKRNRPIREARVAEYARKITEGRMKVHSQGISFSREGTLNNGQHRLLAVIKAGVPCDFYVTFGEDEDAFDVIDTGGVRSAKDALHISGRCNANNLAATARIVINIQRRALVSNGPEARVDNDEVVNFVDANEDVITCLNIADRARKKLRGSLAPLAAAIFLIRKNSKKPEKIDTFLERLTEGANLAATSPILKLRDGIQSRALSDRFRNTVARNSNIVASFIIAWNKWNRAQSGSIRWVDVSEFPEIY